MAILKYKGKISPRKLSLGLKSLEFKKGDDVELPDEMARGFLRNYPKDWKVVVPPAEQPEVKAAAAEAKAKAEAQVLAEAKAASEPAADEGAAAPAGAEQPTKPADDAKPASADSGK